MPLYVIRPPDPPQGQDWQSAVPGQYLYDITGITATLNKPADAPTVAVDSSGNGNDGTYTGTLGTNPFVSGLVTGNRAVRMGGPFPPDLVEGVAVPSSVIPANSDFSIVMLWENTAATPRIFYPVDALAASGASELFLQIADSPGNVMTLSDAASWTWQSDVDAIPNDNLPHLIGVTLESNVVVFYVDGNPLAYSFIAGTPVTVAYSDLAINHAGTSSRAGSGTADEWACWTRALSIGEIAGLNSARSDFATYSAAVLALGPDVYYHLDDGSPVGGRQVVFDVTDGSYLVEEIPTGFAVTTADGPFLYSWQPKLASSSQTHAGASTTVAIPRLILPAGYTVGTRTLDLLPTDQWSDIAIWWDSSIMDTLNNPYEYPPGWHITFPDDPILPIPPGIR